MLKSLLVIVRRCLWVSQTGSSDFNPGVVELGDVAWIDNAKHLAERVKVGSWLREWPPDFAAL